MFTDKGVNPITSIEKKIKVEALINMVLTITTRNKVLENVAFKDKETLKTKLTIEWLEEKQIQKSLKATIHDL